MTRVAILGGSVSGLGTALFLARRGIPSEIFEQDPAALPVRDAQVWGARRPTPQAAHSHAFLSEARAILLSEAPEVLDTLRSDEAVEVSLGGGEVAIACRRQAFERALREAAVADPAISLQLGMRVAGLAFAPGKPPKVTGLSLDSGGVVPADVIVDAGGRRSPVDGWLDVAGIGRDDRSVECGIA
jgi:2-polyprenyl-6-methoxyphenol hydroxylase-like FAD-dependent oxidoreductase